MEWFIKSFESLTAKELYEILKLRINVFMLEQNCLYPECDNKDYKSRHLFAMQDNQCVAYARLLPIDVSYSNCTSIGRVVVNSDYRHLKLGKELMLKAIDAVLEQDNKHDIRISAQNHLRKFYENLGFIAEGEVYLEDDIPHIEMAYYI